jgi:YfiH family protein
MSESPEFLTHPLLRDARIDHGFGRLGSREPPGVIRPIQRHGREVAFVRDEGDTDPGHADAVVSTLAEVPVGVMTADCVPVLLAVDGGRVVAAVHAGWRGIAAGVVASALEAMERVAAEWHRVTAVIGPHIGACCYEVDSPVIEPLRVRFGSPLDSVLTAVDAEHSMLDLGALVRLELTRAGVRPADVGSFPEACTCCDAERFHSHRRDGDRAGRLLHWIAANAAESPTPRPAVGAPEKA